MMQKYQDVVTIIGPPGLIPIVGAQITVYVHGTTNLAVIYSDDGINQTANPTASDSSGRYSFYAADGHYDLSISGNALQTTLLTDILLQDEVANNISAMVDGGTTDNSATLQAEINTLLAAGGGTLQFRAGQFLLNSRIKIQNMAVASRFLQLIGEGSGNQNVPPSQTGGTRFIGQTGGIVFDCAGGNNITFQDIGIYAGTSNPSNIGILYQRTSSNTFCANNKLIRVGIGMPNSTGANGGLGTYGVVNKRGEHLHYYDCWFLANKPHLCDGNETYSSIVSPDFASYPSGSQTLDYYDNCAFLSYSGPCSEQIGTDIAEYRGGYMLLNSSSYGLVMNGCDNIKAKGINAELNGFGGTPNALVNVINNSSNFELDASTNITGLPAVRLTNAANLLNPQISLQGSFTNTLVGVTSGVALGGVVRYNTALGHLVPASTALFGTILQDSNVGLLSLTAAQIGFYGTSTVPQYVVSTAAQRSISSGALASSIAVALNRLGLINCTTFAP